jgi:RHS repeat-associated protein
MDAFWLELRRRQIEGLAASPRSLATQGLDDAGAPRRRRRIQAADRGSRRGSERRSRRPLLEGLEERRLLSAANFQATIVVPSPITKSNQAETITVSYTNHGSAPMAAPMVVLHAIQNGNEAGLMSLSLAAQGQTLNTAATPAGYGQTVDFLASGATPGVLNAGESGSVQVYYGGWLTSKWDYSRPAISFSADLVTTDNATAINWSSIQSSFQPAGISAAAWGAIFANVQSQLGTTWGSYVQRLDQDASYLAGLGETVGDVEKLWSFEIQQANGIGPLGALSTAQDIQVQSPGTLSLAIERTFGPTVEERNLHASFGYGWSLGGGFERTLSVEPDGSVIIADTDGSVRDFAPVGSTYQAQPGDFGTLTSLGNGVYDLTEQDGTVSEFASGRVQFERDADGNATTAGYTNNELTSLTDSSGEWLRFTYNAAGLITKIADSLGQTAAYAYDPTNSYLVSATSALGFTTTYTYTATTHSLASVTGQDGTSEIFAYNSGGWLVSTSINSGLEATTYSYGAGASITATDALGDATTYEFNEQGLLAKLIDPRSEVTTYHYDASGNLISTVDPDGQTTSYTYDTEGHVTQTTDAAGRVTKETYGALDTLTSLTDPLGRTTAHTYDANGDLLSTTFADGTVASDAVNPIGEITRSTDGDGHVTTASYDPDGRLTSESFADGTQEVFTYDGDGNLASASNSSGTTHLSYNSSGLLTEIVYPDGGTLTYSYDSAGRRTQMVDQSADVVNYVYNALSQLTGLTDRDGNAIVSYSYDAAGRVIKAVEGNGAYTTYGYDAAGDTTSVVNYGPSGAVNSSFTYVYNALGLCSSETTSQGSWSYTYDADGELTQAIFTSSNPGQLANQNLTYSYDANGNRTEAIVNGVTTSYFANSRNEYTQVGSSAYTYDRDGNIVSQSNASGVTTYAYNDQGRLVGILGPGIASSIAYNALGSLYSTTQGGQTTYDVVDPTGTNNVVGQYSPGGTAIATYAYGLGLVGQSQAGQGLSYYQFDSQGSTADVTNAAGAVVDSYAYLPFGGTLTSSGTAPNPFQFLGSSGVDSVASGLDLAGARLDDPSLGRFDSPDPLGAVGSGTNLYTYAKNSPPTLSDPSGLLSLQQQITIGKGIWQIVSGSLGIAGGALLIAGTEGLATAPGILGVTEGAASVGAGISNIVRTLNGQDTSLVAGGVFELAGEAIDIAAGNPNSTTGRDVGTLLDVGAGFVEPFAGEGVSTFLGHTINNATLTTAGKAISDISTAIGATTTIVDGADKILDNWLEGESGAETPDTSGAPNTQGTTDIDETFNSNDTVSNSQTLSYNENGTYEGTTSTVYTDNANGTVSSADTSDYSSAGGYEGKQDSTFSYDSSGDLTSDNTSDYNASGFATAQQDTSFTYANGVPEDVTTNDYSVVGGGDQIESAATFGVNSSGDVSQATYDDFNSGAFAGSSESTYTYNSDHQVSDISTNSDNAVGAITGTSNDVYTYNSDGVATGSTTTGDSATGTLEFQDVESYDSTGAPTGSDDTFYNSSGTKSGVDDFTDSGGADTLTSSENWTYPAFGTEPSSSVTDTYNSGSLATSETTDYSGGQPTSAFTDDISGGNSTLGSTESWNYSNPSEPVSTTYDYLGGAISTEDVTDYNSSDDPMFSKTSAYDGGFGGPTTSAEYWYYNPSEDLSATDTYGDFNSAGDAGTGLWDNYDTSGDVTSYSDTSYDIGLNGLYSGALSQDYDGGLFMGTTNTTYDYNSSGLFSGSSNDQFNPSNSLMDYYDIGLSYNGDVLSKLSDDQYDPQGVEQYGTTDNFTNGDLDDLDYETYDPFGTPLSNDDYDETSSGLSLANSEAWQYDPSGDLMGYYTDGFDYSNGGLASTDVTDYAPGGTELGYDNSNYDSLGDVSSENLGFYGTTGDYLGYANTDFNYGTGGDVSGYDTGYYGSNDSLYGSVDQTFDYGAGDDLSGGDLSAFGYSDPSLDGTGSLGYDNGYLNSYDFSGSGFSDSTDFGDDGYPDDSSGFDDATDYGSYDSGDFDSGDDFGFVATAAPMLSIQSSSSAAGGFQLASLVRAASVTTGGPNYFRKVTLAGSGDIGTGQTSANVVGVTESAAQVVGNGDTFQVEQGSTFIANIGSFSDTLGSSSDYSASINWGDGQVSVGIVTATVGGRFAIEGTHHYAKTGSYTISVPVTDNTGAEITNTCIAQVIPSLSRSTVSSGTASLQAGGSTQVTLRVADPSGKAEAVSGLNVSFGLTEGSAGGSFSAVTDHGNGIYTASFSSTSAGLETITASIDGQELNSTGSALSVMPGAVSLGNSTLSIESPGVSVGGAETVTFTARDAYGNLETGGALDVTFVQGISPGSGVFTDVQDLGNGAYSASFTGLTSGTAAIGVDVGGSGGLLIAPTITVGGNTPSPAAQASLADAGFEAPGLPAGAFQFSPAGTPWTFSGGAGISAGGSGFTALNAAAPGGGQVAFIQGSGSVNQTIELAAGTYVLTFEAAQRGDVPQAGQTIAVVVDGNNVSAITPIGSSYGGYSTAGFAVSSGLHVITLSGLNPRGGDNTALVSDVAVQSESAGQTLDPGFDSPGLPAGAFAYGPSGTPWRMGGGAGISASGSAFTALNAAAPGGGQVAFIQGNGLVSQTVNLALGTYTVSFYAAQRADVPQAGQTLAVVIDGSQVDTITPAGTTYQAYETSFTVSTAGSHTLSLIGLNPGGGDSTALVSLVLIQPSAVSQPQDAGFESPGLGAGAFLFSPAGTPWTFSGGAGISAGGSGFTAGNPPAPEGGQVAFIQGNGSLGQAIALGAGTYVLSFYAAQRANLPQAGQTLAILVDGAQVGTFSPAGTAYMLDEVTFTVTEGPHTLMVSGLNPHGGDNTALVDEVSLQAATTAQPQDAGFESPGLAAGSFAVEPSDTPWTFGAEAGISANSSGFTAGNPVAPDGGQVAFIQGNGSLSQTIALGSGTYVLSFYAAQRGNIRQSGQTFAVLVDGAPISTFTPSSRGYALYSTVSFTLIAGTHTVTLAGLNPHGGDNTALVDDVVLALAQSTTQAPPPLDADFDSPSLGIGSFRYSPAGTPWTFGPGTGISANGSGFTLGNPPAAGSGQVAFIQGYGSLSQTIALGAGTYVFYFDAAQRGNVSQAGQSLAVLLDGAQVDEITPAGTTYEVYEVTFTVSAGSHTLMLSGLNPHGGDNTALVDKVSLEAATTAQPQDAGFELPGLAAGGFAVEPSGTPWTFGAGAGISANSSAFTVGNPVAPEGGQVGFIQGNGSLSQTITFAAGTYILSFYAAQRGDLPQAGQTLAVLVDGAQVGTITPAGKTYAFYEVTFTLTAGSHTLVLQGVDPHGGDNTALVDELFVSIA